MFPFLIAGNSLTTFSQHCDPFEDMPDQEAALVRRVMLVLHDGSIPPADKIDFLVRIHAKSLGHPDLRNCLSEVGSVFFFCFVK
jgi:hypothetical protein